MRALKRKAGSQRGASITFALLLFLVCAIISGVVIVAATAAAGRMSQQAEMDERYYAVTAVAGRLKTVFDGQEVTLQYTKSNNTVTNIAPNTIASTDMLAVASVGVFKKEACDVYNNSSSPISSGTDGNIECTVLGTLDAYGTLTYVIEATTKKDGEAKGTYGLTLTFASTLKKTTSDSSQTTASATVKWKMLGAEKKRSDRI